MKYLGYLPSKFGVKCMLDPFAKLLAKPRENGPEMVMVWFSSLGSASSNESAQEIGSTDEVKILHCLNTLTAEQMRQDKNISLRLSELICQYREAYGLFSNLKDLQNVKLVGPKNFKTICKQFVTENVNRTNDTVTDEAVTDVDSIHKYISPELKPSLIESASTVTSMEVCIDSVCFSTMSRDKQLIDWNHITLKGSNHQKQTPAQILDQAVHVLSHLPTSNIVLMENRLSRKITTIYLSYLLFIGRLQMALQTLINEDISKSGEHKVFHIKDSFILKTFELRVGGERVSGQNVMQQIESEQFPHKVSIVPELWQRYNRLESDILKERYSNCLLMSLAFCQHVFVNKSSDNFTDVN